MEFEVVSIRQNKTDSYVSFDHTPRDGYGVEHFSLKAVISSAYGIRWDLISGGPAWITTDFYDIQAKVAGEDVAEYRKLPKARRNAMLQAMLADRFKLSAHIVTKELPGYELLVAKNGPKMKESKLNHETYWANMGDIFTQAMKMPTLAKLLSQQLQQTVADKTGLAGMYEFKLDWASDRSLRANSTAAGEVTQASEPSGPSLFTALEEQLGLKLNLTKGPVDTLVIDHVERPTEN